MEKNELEYDDEKDIHEKEFLDILMDDSSNILIDSMISSKKKLLNAKNGKSEIFAKVKLKAKALDFLMMILKNNHNLSNEDISLVDEYINIFNSSKNDKTVFEQISPKYYIILFRIKQLIALTIKGQIKIGNTQHFSKLVHCVIEIMK